MSNPWGKQHRFNASNKPGTCLWCGRKLRPWGAPDADLGTGYAGTGHFCSLSCGFRFAVDMAKSGKRFVPRKEK